MSLPSKSPRSSRAGSLTNLFGLGTSRNQEIELAHDHHESGHLPGKVLPVPRTSTPRDDENHGEHFEYDDIETSVHSCVALTTDMCASTNRTNDSRNPNPNKEYFYAL